MHSSPNRLAVSVAQLASPKGRHMILDSRFWILDCGLKEHESHCRKRRSGESGSSSIAVMSALRVCLCSCSSPRVKGDSHQILRTQRVQVTVASLRFFRSSTGPNRAFEPQSLGRVRDPVRIAEGPTHDFGFSILDFGLRTEATRVSLPEALRSGESGTAPNVMAQHRCSDLSPPVSENAVAIGECGESGRCLRRL